MYVDAKRTVEINGSSKVFADIYVQTHAEALAVPATDYVEGSKMYIIPEGEMYVACSAGWYDTGGTILS